MSVALGISDRAIEKRNIEGRKTLEKAYELLQETGKCLVARPTGFGKSYMMAHMTQRYNRSLYVYPLEIIKLSVQMDYANVLKNVTFISYRALLEIFKRGQLRDYLDYGCFDIIMFDEAHFTGSKRFRETYDTLRCAAQETNIAFLGASGTPDRMDGFDYELELFNNNRVYEYTLHDCIQDGIMLKPNYVFAQFDVDKALADFRCASNKLKKSLRGNKEKVENVLKQKEIEIANLVNAPNVIRNSYTKLYGEPDYLKFIVFFSSIQNLNDTYKDAENWFKEAFEDLEVNSLLITSEQDKRDNLKLLPHLKYRHKTADLIMCVDMLNMGYHIDDITGVVMIRGTESDIVYKQQIGRCMSVMAKQPPIIFDFVNNYSIHPYFLDEQRALGNSKEREYKFGELSIQDLVIEDKIASYTELIKRLTQLSIEGLTKEIIFLYKNRNMPCYIIAEKMELSRKDVMDILKKSRVRLEDESILKKFGIDGRKLYTEEPVKGVSAVEKFSESYWRDVQ